MAVVVQMQHDVTATRHATLQHEIMRVFFTTSLFRLYQYKRDGISMPGRACTIWFGCYIIFVIVEVVFDTFFLVKIRI